MLHVSSLAHWVVSLHGLRDRQVCEGTSHFSVSAKAVSGVPPPRPAQKGWLGMAGSPFASRLEPLGSGTGSPPWSFMRSLVRHSKPSRQSPPLSHFSMQKRVSIDRGAHLRARV